MAEDEESGAGYLGQVQSLVRAFGLLDALSRFDDGLTLTEIAKLNGLPQSTAHRLLTAMDALRYVEFDPSDNRWRIGIQAFAPGTAFVQMRVRVQIARQYPGRTQPAPAICRLWFGRRFGRGELRARRKAQGSEGRRLARHFNVRRQWLLQGRRGLRYEPAGGPAARLLSAEHCHSDGIPDRASRFTSSGENMPGRTAGRCSGALFRQLQQVGSVRV